MDPSPRTMDRKAVGAWALYDFANSSFTTLVVTFVYGTLFASYIAPDEATGQTQWAIGLGISAALIALLSPVLGAIADRGGYRKRFLFWTTVVCVVGTAVLFFPQQGDVVFALAAFVVANVAFEVGIVFYNAFLPALAPPERIGRVSGWGWSLGYVGGLLCLGVALVVFVQPETPPLGLDKDTFAHVRATNLLVAVWFALFAIPAFLVLEEPPRKEPEGLEAREAVVRGAFRQFGRTFRDIKHYRQIVKLLVARVFYNDGLVTVISFGGIYAAGVLGFETEDVLIFGIVLNVAAAVGAAIFGFVDDALGGKKTVLITVVGLFAASALAIATTSATLFWVAGILIGLLLGPNQAASRSLMGRFVPPAKENEFFGFFAFSGKATAFLGPALLAPITAAFGQRAGISVVLVFFLVGGVLLLSLDEEEGLRVAKEGVAPP